MAVVAGRVFEATDDQTEDSTGAPGPITHRFQMGQRLMMSQGGRDIARQSATCVVTGLVPHEFGPLRYRVRSDLEGFERIVDEVDLSAYRNETP